MSAAPPFRQVLAIFYARLPAVNIVLTPGEKFWPGVIFDGDLGPIAIQFLPRTAAGQVLRSAPGPFRIYDNGITTARSGRITTHAFTFRLAGCGLAKSNRQFFEPKRQPLLTELNCEDERTAVHRQFGSRHPPVGGCAEWLRAPAEKDRVRYS